MTRLPLILPMLAAAGAMAVALGRCLSEPDQRDVAEEAGPVPTTCILRNLAKRDLAREAVVGRRPPVEAAALFRELNRLPPALDSPMPAGRTEEERLCRQVIAYVTLTFNDWTDAGRQAAVARLEAELRDESCRAGGTRLPDAAGLPAAHELIEQARARLTGAQRRALLGESSEGLDGRPE